MLIEDAIAAGFSSPLIMGVLNVTPDSFSDGGRFTSEAVAVEQGLRMAAEGADIIDVGGESTRPGAERVAAAEQIRRVEGIIARLRRELPATCSISIDTTRAEVATRAIEAGADMVNDVAAGRDDPALFEVVAAAEVPLVLMHMQGDPATMQQAPSYGDVVAEVRAFLLERAAAAEAVGVARQRIILDPGIGFGKKVEHNARLIARLRDLVRAPYPVLLGTSRKSFLGKVTGRNRADERIIATAATTVMGVLAGVKLFRVHDVAANRDAMEVALAIVAADD
ncbi:MAG: dihydropteroate synthase [Gammaproteobacteria bacterium]|nr:dihydropteroate synthase [Gammaproteobacteria bacterium]